VARTSNFHYACVAESCDFCGYFPPCVIKISPNEIFSLCVTKLCMSLWQPQMQHSRMSFNPLLSFQGHHAIQRKTDGPGQYWSFIAFYNLFRYVATIFITTVLIYSSYYKTVTNLKGTFCCFIIYSERCAIITTINFDNFCHLKKKTIKFHYHSSIHPLLSLTF
jgi:hypothetical protein